MQVIPPAPATCLHRRRRPAPPPTTCLHQHQQPVSTTCIASSQHRHQFPASTPSTTARHQQPVSATCTASSQHHVYSTNTGTRQQHHQPISTTCTANSQHPAPSPQSAPVLGTGTLFPPPISTGNLSRKRADNSLLFEVRTP